MRDCRTAALGSHKERCDNINCNQEIIAYDSCRNRHCNKCGSNNRLKWVTARLKELLPVGYYHVVTTLPPLLHDLSYHNIKVVFDIFFKSTSYALNDLAQEPRFLGAELGFVGILHTWGQRLNFHPHIHFIVPAGGLSWDYSHWVHLPYRKDFLFPVKSASKRIRDRFIKLLKRAYRQGKLKFPGDLAEISSPDAFDRFCDSLYSKAFYCYSKPPFSGAQKVIEYLGRYIHRVAISNWRLNRFEGGRVYFEWRDYKDKGRVKETSLPVQSFLSRYFMHVMPWGFRKVRHYGFLSPGKRVLKVGIIRCLFEDFQSDLEAVLDRWTTKIKKYIDHRCPKCGVGRLILCFDTS
jgi:hypothetical protein